MKHVTLNPRLPRTPYFAVYFINLIPFLFSICLQLKDLSGKVPSKLRNVLTAAPILQSSFTIHVQCMFYTLQFFFPDFALAAQHNCIIHKQSIQLPGMSFLIHSGSLKSWVDLVAFCLLSWLYSNLAILVKPWGPSVEIKEEEKTLVIGAEGECFLINVHWMPEEIR